MGGCKRRDDSVTSKVAKKRPDARAPTAREPAVVHAPAPWSPLELAATLKGQTATVQDGKVRASFNVTGLPKHMAPLGTFTTLVPLNTSLTRWAIFVMATCRATQGLPWRRPFRRVATLLKRPAGPSGKAKVLWQQTVFSSGGESRGSSLIRMKDYDSDGRYDIALYRWSRRMKVGGAGGLKPAGKTTHRKLAAFRAAPDGFQPADPASLPLLGTSNVPADTGRAETAAIRKALNVPANREMLFSRVPVKGGIPYMVEAGP